MKERPILFSGPMVRAILAGTKTMTRRVVKPQLPRFEYDPAACCPECGTKPGHQHCWRVGGEIDLKCPFGQPGDRLWVKEALVKGKMLSILTGEETNADAALFEADGSPVLVTEQEFDAGWSWKRPKLPAMYCPRWASRLTLELTEVRVQRLQDISEEDAEAEGFPGSRSEHWSAYDPVTQGYPEFFAKPERAGLENIRQHPDHVITSADQFRRLWDDLNAKRGYGWDANPWTWAISFKRVDAKRDAA